jgi:shikimate kinase
MNNIYLVGFMGTGKTSVGRELAKQKNRLENRGLASNSQSQWQFIDLDELIELSEKRSIPDIFTKEGEPYFRRIEKRVLKEVSVENKFVVACGGGIVLDKENIKIMRETGIIICLAATPEVILNRTSGYAHRPLLNVSDPKKQIELLLKLRSPFYAQADKIIDTSKASIKQIVGKILKIIAKKK